jgi:NIMA (never in mitosis gene a)-related kinase
MLGKIKINDIDSPEVWRDEPYTIKSDIWSLGCVLYEMITLRPPFMADDMQSLFRKVNKAGFQRIPKHYTYDLSYVLK